MQANDGAMVGITETQFEDFLHHGNTNLCRVGDVFRVRRCYFEVETISNYGISAKGITRHEYHNRKNKQVLSNKET